VYGFPDNFEKYWDFSVAMETMEHRFAIDDDLRVVKRKENLMINEESIN
jgi:hypothetical protein